MEKWGASVICQKPCPLHISCQFNLTWLNVIIVKEYLSGFIRL